MGSEEVGREGGGREAYDEGPVEIGLGLEEEDAAEMDCDGVEDVERGFA